MSNPDKKRTKRGVKPNTKRDPPDRIAKSKQLLRKKSKSPTKRATRLSKKTDSSNYKFMLPTLADLEQMYEESDNNILETPSRTLNNETVASKETTTQINSDEIEMTDYSSNKHTTFKTKSNCSEKIIVLCDSDYSDTDESANRPKKRKKIEDEPSSNLIFNDPQVETSNDSEITLAYDVNILSPGRFSPIPSTSRDSDTILQNEMRFNASLVSKESPKRSLSPRQDHRSISQQNLSPNLMIGTQKEVIAPAIQVIESPEKVIGSVEVVKSSKQVKELTETKVDNKTFVETIVIDDEDDFSVIIGTEEQKETRSLPSPIVIEDEYNVVPYNEDSLFNISDISVDDIIAENSSILKKYSDKTPVIVTEVPPVQTESQNIINLSARTDSVGETTDPVHESRIEAVSTPNTQVQQNNQDDVIDESVILEEEIMPSIQIRQPFQPHSHNLNCVLESVLDVLRQIGKVASKRQNNSRTTNTTQYTIDRTPRTGNNSPPTHTYEASYSRKKHKSKTHTQTTNFTNVQPATAIEIRSASPPGLETNNVVTSETNSGRNIGDCPICLDPLASKSICSTICGHIFCMECIKRAVKTSKRCPTCRKILKNNGYHQLFL